MERMNFVGFSKTKSDNQVHFCNFGKSLIRGLKCAEFLDLDLPLSKQ